MDNDDIDGNHSQQTATTLNELESSCGNNYPALEEIKNEFSSSFDENIECKEDVQEQNKPEQTSDGINNKENHDASSTTNDDVDEHSDEHHSEIDGDDSGEECDDFSFIDDLLEKGVDKESLKPSSEEQSQPQEQEQQQQQSQQPKHQRGSKRKLGPDGTPTCPFGKNRKSKVETKQKSVLIKRGHDLFEILPEGWVEITHFSGLPIYLDKKTRVCTTTKPYHLGTGSARKHHIPLSAIPCLQYKIELEKEKQEKEKKETTAEENTTTPQEISITNESKTTNKPFIAKVETLEENKKEKSLDSGKVRDYCKNLFEFKTVTVKKFTNWAERRKHDQSKRMAQRPTLPESTKLITCTIPKNVALNSPGKTLKKEFIMNPAGKSDVCILHEYVQHTERTQPKYVFEELEKASKPYCATVFINEMEYGKGYGVSKKEAKSEAARASLDILIPDLKKTVNGQECPQNKSISLNDLNGVIYYWWDRILAGTPLIPFTYHECGRIRWGPTKIYLVIPDTLRVEKFFDDISIEDQRVNELCLKTGQYTPYQILVECIKRLYGIEDMDIKIETKVLTKHQKIEFKMTVGQHVAVVRCKNKKEGKQRAAQKILKILHPNLKSWGSLLKLYGQGSCKTTKEKKEEAQKITELQNNACSNRPNYAILNKLKEEMLKLRLPDHHQQQENHEKLKTSIIMTSSNNCSNVPSTSPYHNNNKKRKFNRTLDNSLTTKSNTDDDNINL